MVVLLLKGDVHTLLFETVGKATEKVAPALPKELDLLIHPEKIIDKAIDKATGAAAEAVGIDPTTAELLKQATTPGELENMAADAFKKQVESAEPKNSPSPDSNEQPLP